MLNDTNSSSSLSLMRHSLLTSLSSSTAVWIIEQKNLNFTLIDTSPLPTRIMWYRFLLIIVIFITAFGNLLVCLAIARERKLQNTTNYFLMSLAIADCLVAILVMPMGMITEVLGYFPLPHYACIIFATMDVLCCTSSIWHMSTMSMDRYFTIRFPFRYGRNKTRRIMLLKIIGVWAISFAVSSPVFVLGILNKDFVLSNGICAPNNAFFQIYGSIFAFYIPFLIMIITYALTMRSLRNVLVNKKKYDRERRQKQTFRPLAQIINQYAEIAQGIRRTSSTRRSTHSATLINSNPTHSNSILTKTPFAIITTASSPQDSRGQFFSSNNNLDLQQETTSINQINNTNNELIHHNSQHLNISYKKSSGSKKRRYQQQHQQLQQNSSNNRTKNDLDMSTVYEISEYSKSTSSCYDVSVILNANHARRSIISFNNDQKPMKIDETIEPTPILSNTNDISTVKEEERSSISDFDSEIDTNDCVETEIHSTVSHPKEPILLNLSWKSCVQMIQSIIFYYITYFPYRLRPLALEYPRSENMKPCQIERSTSTTSLYFNSLKTYRTNSSQTNTYGLVDYNHTNINGHYNTLSSPKRRRFPFNRPLIPASSLLTNLFRQSPTPPVRSSESSTKSSLSWGQRSSAASSSNQMRQSYAMNIARHIESSEIECVLPYDRRSRASTSSSCLLHTTYRHGNSVYTHYHKPLARQQYQSRSVHVLPNLPKTRSLFHQQLSSTTNTNSSDSSSIIQRYQSRLFSTIPNQHRTRDEDFVAANERKALRVLMIIFCVFVTLWTPFFVCTFLSAVCYQCRERITPTIWFSITWLGYGSSMANPFIYTIFSDVFRRAFLNIICCRSKETLIISRQYSTKYSSPKYGAQQYVTPNLLNRRSQNQDPSGTSTPVPFQQPTTIAGSDALIYPNRCASDAFR